MGRSAAAVVLPYDSTDQAASGVLAQAVASGRPVVATAFPHAVELLGTGANQTMEQLGYFGSQVRASFEESSGGHPLPAVAAFLWFLMAYTPCVATLAAQRREVGRRWTAFGVALGLTVAWLGAVAIFQVGSLFW